MMKPNMKQNGSQRVAGIAVYTRVSTEGQARARQAATGVPGRTRDIDGSSPESQLHRCRQYIAVQFPDINVQTIRVYADDGYSGKDTNRPEFQRLLRDVRRGLVQQVVFTELSRVSRSVRDFLHLTDEFQRFGVALTSLREQIDTSTPQGKMLTTLLMTLAEFEREQAALRTRLNMRARAERGLYNGGGRMLGYRPDPTQKGNLVVHEDEARIVRSVFDVYLEIGSVPLAVRRLKDLGCVRPAWTSSSGKHYPAQPILWDTVRNIISNPTYIARKEINRKVRYLSPEEMETLPVEERYRTEKAVWPAIIDVETFTKANHLLAENRQRGHSILVQRKHDFVLTGLLFCQHCGRGLEGASAKKQTYYYYQHAQGTKTDGCPCRAWNAAGIEDAVIERLGLLADDDDLLTRVIEAANQRLMVAAPAAENDLKAARSRIARAEADVQALMERLMATPKDEVPPAFWKMAQAKDADLAAARSEVARLESELQELRAKKLHAATYRNALRNFKAVYARLNSFDRANLLGYLIDRIDLGKDGVSLWLLGEDPEGQDANRPDGEYHGSGEWLRQRDSNPRPGG